MSTARVVDVEADARRAFDCIRAGGIAILPMDVGYSLIGSVEAALRKIFDTKRRAPSKLNAMLGDDAIHREVHLLDRRQRAIVDAIVADHGLPLALSRQRAWTIRCCRRCRRQCWSAAPGTAPFSCC